LNAELRSTSRGALHVATPQILRVLVCLHAAAFFLLPKDSFGLTTFRPEDLTAMLLLFAAGVLAVSGALPLPDRSLAQITAVYFGYFLLVLVQDVTRGHIQATVFWFKELSTVVFAYFIWLGFEGEADRLVTALAVFAMPNIAYGVYQWMTTPRGIYGVAPLGHEASPASAGMIYLTCSFVMFLKCISMPRRRVYSALLLLSLALTLTAGSKVAVVGGTTFYGWYLIEVAVQKRDAASIRRIAWFAASTVGGITLAVSAAGLGYSWRGLARYRGLLEPLHIIATRGIWWKIGWLKTPLSIFFGAGYSPSHLLPDNQFAYGMSMDNQALYYLVTGGVIALGLYLVLLMVLFAAISPEAVSGRVLRSLVISYFVMGLGAEVLQLSIHGNAFWMVVGLCLAMRPSRAESRSASRVSFVPIEVV
jgi:hypothetical protein